MASAWSAEATVRLCGQDGPALDLAVMAMRSGKTNSNRSKSTAAGKGDQASMQTWEFSRGSGK